MSNLIAVFHESISFVLIMSIYLTNVNAADMVTTSNLKFPTADIVLDTNRGFILKRIGTYSNSYTPEVLHTFVPLNDFCSMSPSNELCTRSSLLINQNSITIGNIMSSIDEKIISDQYTEKELLDITNERINKLFLDHSPGDFTKSIASSFHFFDNQFYVSLANVTCQDDTCNQIDTSDRLKYSERSKETTKRVLQQLEKKQIGFEFLVSDDIDLFLSPMMSSIDSSYVHADRFALMNDFLDLVIYQSVTVFRSCSSLHDNKHFPPCLVISTVYQRPVYSDEISYNVYDSLALPIFSDGYEYQFEIPSMIGFNYATNNLLIWNSKNRHRCIFRKWIRCFDEQYPINLDIHPCLRSLFSHEFPNQTICPVKKNGLMHSELHRVSENIWISHNSDQALTCHSKNPNDRSINILTTQQSTVIRLPCRTDLTCREMRLRTRSCNNAPTTVNGNLIQQAHDKQILFEPLENLQRNLLSGYRTQLRNFRKDLDDERNNKFQSLSTLMKEFSSIFLLGLLTLFLTFLLFVIKLIKQKLQRQLNYVERKVNTMSDIYLGETIPS